MNGRNLIHDHINLGTKDAAEYTHPPEATLPRLRKGRFLLSRFGPFQPNLPHLFSSLALAAVHDSACRCFCGRTWRAFLTKCHFSASSLFSTSSNISSFPLHRQQSYTHCHTSRSHTFKARALHPCMIGTTARAWQIFRKDKICVRT